MPLPTLAQLWRGHSPITDEPSAYRILRVISASAGAWQEIDIRNAAFAGAADGLAQDADSAARGILRMVAVLNMSATAGEAVKVSLAASSGNPDPATAYNVAMVNGPSVELRIPGRLGITKFWMKSDAGTPDVQLELWYDVPPAS